ncbi:MAG: methyltransferase domain-containing protein [Candidatus Latescibacterota bacterium]
MLSTHAADILVCPSCKEDLRRKEKTLTCVNCRIDYPIKDGIPCLFPVSNEMTIDPDMLRIKNKTEAMNTISEMSGMDMGIIKHTKFYYLLYLLIVLCLVMGMIWTASLFLLGLCIDWIYFRRKRDRILSRFARNPLRLRTSKDYQCVDELYKRQGQVQPTMTDWVSLAQEAASTGESAASADAYGDERYLDILRVYRERPFTPDIVVDVGTNDGLAYTKFGIGKDKTFIGIDVSHLLLKQFIENIPDQTALEADGACLPLGDDSVDFLFCTETLEHLPDPDEAICEFLRVLKPGGCLMIQSPNAHRLRNLNLFHILSLFASLISDIGLQKKVIHENTWHNATTYHWDFSIQDYQRMIQNRGAKILELRGCGFFFPEFLLGGRRDLFRMKERYYRSIPFIRYFGNDLVLVAEKKSLQPAANHLVRRVRSSAPGLAEKPC